MIMWLVRKIWGCGPCQFEEVMRGKVYERGAERGERPIAQRYTMRCKQCGHMKSYEL